MNSWVVAKNLCCEVTATVTTKIWSLHPWIEGGHWCQIWRSVAEITCLWEWDGCMDSWPKNIMLLAVIIDTEAFKSTQSENKVFCIIFVLAFKHKTKIYSHTFSCCQTSFCPEVEAKCELSLFIYFADSMNSWMSLMMPPNVICFTSKTFSLVG